MDLYSNYERLALILYKKTFTEDTVENPLGVVVNNHNIENQTLSA